jgi:hypothetical protein
MNSLAFNQRSGKLEISHTAKHTKTKIKPKIKPVRSGPTRRSPGAGGCGNARRTRRKVA